MNDINISENTAIIDDAVPSKDGKKRITWVSKDHASMVAFVSAIYKNLGHTDFHSNKEIAKQHNLSPDSIKQHLSSAQQYRLLEIKHGTGYKITELFKRIFLYVNETEKKAAVIESLRAPDTYTALFKEYEKHILPPLNGLKNHFVRNYHFKEDVAERTAQIFLDNLVEYNLLDQRGVLTLSTSNNGTVNAHATEDTPRQKPVEPKEVNRNKDSISDTELFELPIPLGKGRKAFLKYPINDLTKKDIKVIVKALAFVASSIDIDDEDEDFDIQIIENKKV